MTLPPDRGHLATEAVHPETGDLDTLGPAELVRLMARDAERVPAAVAGAAEAIGRVIGRAADGLRRGGRLVYCGAGTSGRLGVLDASECPPTFRSDPAQVVGIIAGGDGALRRSSEGREDEPEGIEPEFTRLGIGADDTVVGIAAGGTTPYVLGAIRLAKARGAATALVTCVRVPRPEGCDELVFLDTGPEVLTGSTRLKAGSATKLALNAISTGVFVRLGTVHGNLMVDLAATNDKLVDRAVRILRHFDPELDREAARRLLDAAGGKAKVAIVMRRCEVDAAQAIALLEAAGGSLREALERRPAADA
jgi:N-acetylmuramic acid 6-phosphate etherase